MYRPEEGLFAFRVRRRGVVHGGGAHAAVLDLVARPGLDAELTGEFRVGGGV